MIDYESYTLPPPPRGFTLPDVVTYRRLPNNEVQLNLSKTDYVRLAKRGFAGGISIKNLNITRGRGGKYDGETRSMRIARILDKQNGYCFIAISEKHKGGKNGERVRIKIIAAYALDSIVYFECRRVLPDEKENWKNK